MKHEFVQEQEKSLLKLQGEFIIQYISEARDILLKALEESEDVEVSLENVTAMDVSSLQLLCSAHRSFVQNKKSLKILNEVPSVVLQCVSEAGFLRRTSCPLDTGNTCLWIMEKT